MEFEGTVYKIMPVTKGTSARGEWQRQDVVFEMNEGSFTRKICVTFFNKPDDVARLREGRGLHRLREHRVARVQRPLVHRHSRMAHPAQTGDARRSSDARHAAHRRRARLRLRSGRGRRPAVLTHRKIPGPVPSRPGEDRAAREKQMPPTTCAVFRREYPAQGRCVPAAAVRTAPNRLRSSANAPGPENLTF